MIEIIAKSNSETLISHSFKISEKSLTIFNENINKNIEPYQFNIFEKVIRIASLLHDIGKCTHSFQNYIRGNDSTINKFLHNEIGWAFFRKYIKVENIENEKITHYIADLIYWHHGIKNEQNKHKADDILDSIDENDIEVMKYISNKLIKSVDGITVLDEPLNINPKSPKFFGQDENDINIDHDKIFLRSILISADREINDNKTLRNHIDYDITKYNGSERFNTQLSIINNESKNIILKAPAGFGKTLTGLLWNIKNSNRKLIWVCPRNMVAESVYLNVLDEIKNLNISNIKVELFLTGEVKDKNHDDDDIFNSDIIVTNIDNFLTPSINNSVASRMYYLLACDVVFDEYHEIIGSEALFSLFILLMKMRLEYSNSKTMLMSATPTNIYKLWDNNLKHSIILPDIKSHYTPIHDNYYEVEYKEIENELKIENESLYIFNSIDLAQSYKNKYKDSFLLHSKFTSEDRNKNFNKIWNNYSKNRIANNRVGVIGTHIIQSSLDISFKELNESILSPESSLQRIGRCDRWGETPNSKIIFIEPRDKKEIDVINNMYDSEMNKLWSSYLKKNIQKRMRLKDFYSIYNNFYQEYDKNILTYIKNKKKESDLNLEFIYSKKFNNKSNDKLTITNSVKLRTSDIQIFCTCKDIDGNWIESFTDSIRYGYKSFGESDKTFLNMKKDLNLIINNRDKSYGYLYPNLNKTKLSKIKNIDKLRGIDSSYSKNYDEPYLRYDIFYDKELGIIKN